MTEFEYTPHPDTVLDAYIRFRYEQQPAINLSIAEFDRWLRSVQADAFEQGFYVASDGQFFPEPGENPYREEEK